MTAFVFYSIDHMSWGDTDDRTGHYLMRITVVLDKGEPIEVISRVPIAQFVTIDSDAVAEAISFSKAIGRGDAIFLPQGWSFDDLAAELKK